MTDRTHRNISIIIIIAALILIWGLALMTADKAQAASVGVINIDIGVNVRSGPGTDYDIIGGISYGSSVTITGQSGNWYIINYNGRTGYISADYVTISSEEEFTQTTATVNSSIGLNVRSGPGTTYSVLYTLDNGTVVTVTDKEGDWYKISYNGQAGYVSGEYLILDENKDYVYDEDFEAALTAEGFPESYKYYLRQLHASHPEWVFKAHDTGLSWSDVIAKETASVSTNLVHKSSPDSWKSSEPGAVDSSGNYIEFDSGGWVAASKSIVEYYMDPRNFLTEGGIFQFMAHSYDSQTQTKSGLQQLVGGTFLADKFPEAGYDTYSDVLIYAAQFKYHGFRGGMKKFASPSVMIAPLNVMEIGIRPLSLCFRLFGNILGAYIIMELIKIVCPLVLPIPFSLYFDIFDGILQAVVFVFLTTLFLSESLED